MSMIAFDPRGWHLRWHTKLVLVCVPLVAMSLVLSPLMPLLTTVVAVVAGTGFVLGVSASISAFFERDSYADSDFWR